MIDLGLAIGLCMEDVLSLRELKRLECTSCAACEGGGHILSAAEREGTSPCSAAESLRLDGADAKAARRLDSRKVNGHIMQHGRDWPHLG